MYKKITAIALAGVLGFAGFVAPTADAASKAYDSKAYVEFEENTTGGGGEIVDPENPNPENPVDPKDPEVNPGTDGPLSIDYVSNFYFGDEEGNTPELKANGGVYYAKAAEFVDAQGNEVFRTPFAQVTDNRGSLDGWKLSVEQSENFTTANGEELKGAEISLVEGNVASVVSTDGITPQAVTIGADKSLVLSAEKDFGAGTTTTSFGELNAHNVAEGIQLEVPGGNNKVLPNEVYKAELTWTIENAK